jgi:hypothetical protein
MRLRPIKREDVYVATRPRATRVYVWASLKVAGEIRAQRSFDLRRWQTAQAECEGELLAAIGCRVQQIHDLVARMEVPA